MNAGATGAAGRDTPRAEAQRERILCAAQKCFIERGFHAASMANIAETAGMSAGLMYRYFDNKNAIVVAIVRRQLEEGRQVIARLHSSADLAADILDSYAKWQARAPSIMSPTLFLEIRAEATRDAQIAAALSEWDRCVFDDLASWMARPLSDGGLGLPPETAARRTFLLLSFMSGLALRSLGQAGIDDASVREVIEKFVEKAVLP